MHLEIVTPEKKLFTGSINSIKVPGKDGEFEILNNHAPIISTLIKGEIRIISTDQKTENFQISGGVIEMQKNNIIVLVTI
ncbi:MAG: ATP synthase F1 subunit epsilon [Flavobacteriales bacterium]|nr:ATP synthase F1 subunit epsilon [Flavobacteriales bacterium]|tara:strand:- start:11104 stop:11343 length:240 start_codon:yes stop_codon:yes gene_type:complete